LSANDKQVGGTHYRKGGSTQHWDFVWEHGYDWFQASITKYIHRHKFKNGLEDLRKAQHYLTKYIELLEAEAERDLVQASQNSLMSQECDYKVND
jgi:hypothetical protein